IAVFWVLVVVLALHIGLHLYGTYRWEAYASESEVLTSWDRVIPDEPASSDNFWAAPTLALATQADTTTSQQRNQWHASWGPHPTLNTGLPWRTLEIPATREILAEPNWASFQQQVRQVPDVPLPPEPQSLQLDLRRLVMPYQNYLDTLYEATATRPQARIPGTYDKPWDLPRPDLQFIDAVASLVYFDGHLALLQQDDRRAFAALRTLERMAATDLISPADFSVRLAAMHFLPPLALEGIRLNAWSEPQLAHLRQLPATTTLFEDWKQLVIASAAVSSDTVTAFLIEERDDAELSGTDASQRFVSRWLVPDGLYHLLQVATWKRAEALLALADARTRTAKPQAHGAMLVTMRESINPVEGAAMQAQLASVASLPLVAYLQNQLDQIAIAAALRAYRRETGDYPESLSALASELPAIALIDPVSGEAYAYRRLAPGEFHLAGEPWPESVDAPDVSWGLRTPLPEPEETQEEETESLRGQDNLSD
ncbi:MAG: hypothetical protein ACFB21_04285, partial [Opitutales bacterium]